MTDNEKIQELSFEEKQYYLTLVKKENYISFDEFIDNPNLFGSKKGIVAVYDPRMKSNVLFLLNPNVREFDKDDKLAGVDFVSIKPLKQIQDLFDENDLERPKFCVETISEDNAAWAKSKYKENLLELAKQNNKPIPIDKYSKYELEISKPGWNAIVANDDHSKVLWLEFRDDNLDCNNAYGPTYVNMLPTLKELQAYEVKYRLYKSDAEFIYTHDGISYYTNYQEFIRAEVSSLIEKIKEDKIKEKREKEEKEEEICLSKEEIKEWINIVPKENRIKLNNLDFKSLSCFNGSGWYIIEKNENSELLYMIHYDAEKRYCFNNTGPSVVVLSSLKSVNEYLDENGFSPLSSLKEFRIPGDNDDRRFVSEKEFRDYLIEEYDSDVEFWDDPKSAKIQQEILTKKEKTTMAKKNKGLSAEEIAIHLEQAKALGAKTIEASEFIDNSPGADGGIFIVTAGLDEDGENIADYEESTPIAILYFNTNGHTANILGPCAINLTEGDTLYQYFDAISCCFENSTTKKIDYSVDGSSYHTKEEWESRAKDKIEELVKFGFSPPTNCPENLLPDSYKSGAKTATKKTAGKAVSGLKETVKSDLSAVATRVAVKKSTELFSALIIDFLASNKEGKEATAMKKKVKDLLSTEDGKAAFQILIGALLPMLTNSDKVPENIKDVIDTVGKGFRTDGMTHFAVEFVDYLSGPGAEKVRTTVIKAFESFKKLDEMTNENGEINIRALAEPTLSLLSLPQPSKKEEEENCELVETNVSELKQSLKNRRS